MSNNYTAANREYRKNKGKVIALIVAIAALALVLLIASLAYVPVGATGVLKTFGAPNGKVLANGLHFKAPFVQTVDTVSNQIQKLEVEAGAVSKDLQAVHSVIAVNYKVSPASSVDIVRNLGAKLYEDKILSPAVQESVKSVTAKYTAEGLITERAKVGAEIALGLESKVTEYGIVVQEFNIVDFDFSEAFNRAIEEKQVAQQNLIRVKTEQEQEVVKAEAAAAAAKARAEAILTEAEAQAAANRKLADSLTANLVEYEKIQKWDGKMPSVSGSNAIVDFRGVNP
ncbi:MAG: prohibitin family protein [Oscillospiraceae bacterium]|jgi:regulator of protease activity HflC (stomatin/prohibitin superfamily)|nr:prohibitin family protein [Oscillospiraceae bacterium]